MARQVSDQSEARFSGYVEALTSVLGDVRRATPLKHYCAGLLTAEGRKSVEPMAAVTAPASVSVQHQKLLNFIANAPWSDEQMLLKIREQVLPTIERHGPIEAWIIDDTAFPKQGSHSVGVHHQYCGQLGKQANCQVVVTLSVANHHASLPIAYRLYLPQEWAEDAARRRRKARIPDEIVFKTKPEIALEQIQAACKAGVPRGVGLMDPSYGCHLALRKGIRKLGLTYVAGISYTVKVLAAPKGGEPARMSVKDAALKLSRHAWRTITWRQGTCDPLRSRFARIQVHASPTRGRRGHPEETLLIEWPENETEPTKYWLSTVDKKTSFRDLVDLAKMRWRIERDYQELKQEIGLGHYEGRGWPGFHHHGALCIAAYGFLISERETIPPSGLRCSRRVKKAALPSGYRPRGATAAPTTSHPQFNPDLTPQTCGRYRSNAASMPMLRSHLHTKGAL